ncbi:MULTISPECIES: NAD(P)H-binding protein [unclassified Arthrobacter]|uniref:SDR family oxidoreductase n=1 Tax=unclassified Arthrobacter TaxID=235627 RepID=UPI001CFFC736|nr:MULTISPECIES: NAD(P)H-binding protein [unclassified Arthrobacter]WGZ78598.1 NAD(P)H-binding protein [Arthrobacter sp. EM1]
MTRICVAGGTGQVGREVVHQAVARGHVVTFLSRNPPEPGPNVRTSGAEYFPADVATGAGLAAALAGADVVIDCLEGRAGNALAHFADGGARLLAAAQDAGVARAVLLSIVNCDRSAFAYYASKAAKEQVYARAGIDSVTVRVTQFHSFLATIFAAGSKLRVIPVVDGVRFQPIAPADAAAALLEAALEPSAGNRHSLRTIGGPEIQDMRDFARQWKAATGSRGLLIRLPLPGALGEYLRAGLNVVPEQRRAGETFSGWLAKKPDSL